MSEWICAHYGYTKFRTDDAGQFILLCPHRNDEHHLATLNNYNYNNRTRVAHTTLPEAPK